MTIFPLESATRRFALRNAVEGDQDSIRSVVDAVLREHGFAPDPAGIDADLNCS